MIIELLAYLSIPLSIRYVIARRPLQSPSAALFILLFVFLIFTTIACAQREQVALGMKGQPVTIYNPYIRPVGCPILYVSLLMSFYILTGFPRLNSPDPRDLVARLKKTIKDDTIHTIPDEELYEIYREAKHIYKKTGKCDPDLFNVLHKLCSELAKRQVC